MKNEKRRKAEKVQDKLEPEKALVRNLARIVDRLDDHSDAYIRFIALLEGTKSLKVENLDEVKIPSTFTISNLKDIPFPEWKLPDVFSVKVDDKPEWYKEPQPFPEIQKFPEKILIDWEHAPKQNDQAPPWIVEVIATAFGKLAELWQKGITTHRAEDDRLKPQMSVLIDPETGKPISVKDLRPIVNVEQRIPPTGASAGGGGPTDVTDRAARLLGIVYGNLAQIQQRAVTLEQLTWDKNLETVFGTASLLNAGRLKVEASPLASSVWDVSDRVARLLGSVSLGVSSGKTNIMKTGSLTTTATTADQVVLTYTVTSGKTFYLEYFEIEARITTLSGTASILGTASLENPSGTKGHTSTFTNQTTSEVKRIVIPLAEPIPIAAGTVIRVVCTPAAATSMLWIGNFGGYEK